MKRFPVLILFLVIFLSSLLLAGCGEGKPSCPENVTRYISMLQELKDQLPYYNKPLDTLEYVTNLNDTISFIGSGMETSYTDEYERDPNPECNVYTIRKREGYSIGYLGEGMFLLEHNGEISDNIRIRFEGFDFLLIDRYIGNPPTTTKQAFLDSMMINQIMYYNLTRHPGVNPLDTIWINNKYGVLKVVAHNGKSFTLIR